MKSKKYIKYGKSLLLIAGIFVFISCRNESEPGSSPIQGVRIIVGEALLSDYPDDRISSLRVIAVDPVRGIIARNVFYPDVNLDHTVMLQINTGTYDFIFLANEPLPMRGTLNGMVTMDDLNSISFPASAFNSDDDIPMIHTQNGVTVLSDNQGVIIGGAPPVSTWYVTMERLAVRLDIVLRSDVDLTADFNGVNFSNLPDNVPLFGDYSGTHSTTRTFLTDRPEDAKYFRDTTIAGAAWAKVIYRVIVPSNVFSPVGIPERVAVMDVLFTDPATVMSCTLGIDEANSNYTLPRNKYVTVNGLIRFPMEVNLEVADWINTNINGNAAGRFLNVSDLAPQVYNGAVTRLYFWSNQPSVVVENLGYTGTTGSATFTVNTQFNNLSGSGSPNLSYDPVTGMGFIDIASLSNTAGTTTNRIILNANGLRRELTVTVNMASIPSWSAIRYVGTFHRWNQTGERIISLANTGQWSAQVVSGDFIILNRNPSPATIAGILGTTSPGDAENYQVPGNATSVSGNGRIFFRVGLTGAAPSSDVPRYGVIRVTTAGNVQSLIYVRQGEAPDFINSTIKWSPYNLSDPLRGLGGPNAADHSLFTPQAPVVSTTFADYPTQVGYMFRWNLYNPTETGTNRAWNPRNPSEINSERITGYPSEPAEVWNTANDPCPAGYRHPTPAEFLTFAPDGSNSYWGFYADGFFDRGTIVSDADFTGVMGAVNYQFGTYGRLFYNAATNAAIFMPVAGTRVFGANNGYLQYSTFAAYPTSSLSGNGNVVILLFSNGTVTQNSENYNPGRALAVRCVKNVDLLRK